MTTLDKRQSAAPFYCVLANYFIVGSQRILFAIRGYFRIGFQLISRICFFFRKRFYSLFSIDSNYSTESAAENNHIDYVMGMSLLLREPLRQTVKILRENAKYLQGINSMRNRRQTTRTLTYYKETIEILDRENFLQLQNKLEQSRIVCSYHFGDFVYGLNALMCLENPKQRRLLLSQEVSSDDYFRNISACFGDRAVLSGNQLLVANTDVLQLRALLMTQATTLTLFCDLTQKFGECCQVSFLGRPAWFPKGPATLAITSKVPLFPAISFTKGRKNFVRVFPIISPHKSNHESLEQAVARVTQDLVNILEVFLKKYPQQWKFLRVLPDYFRNST